ncbi:MAG: PLP-dependent lyase/thiolase [Nitrososphaeria archaeon]
MESIKSIYPTPLVRLPELSKRLDNEIFAKLELYNPTGSHKDRESIAVLDNLSRKEVVIASTGNAAISLSALALGYGVKVHVFVSKSISKERLSFIKTFRPVLHLVEGSYSDAIRQSEEFATRNGIESANPGKNFNKILGDSSIGEEIGRQLSGNLDYIIVPTNNGTLLSGIWLGIKKTARPRMIAAVAPNSVLMESIAGYHRFDGGELDRAISESGGEVCLLKITRLQHMHWTQLDRVYFASLHRWPPLRLFRSLGLKAKE